MMSRERVLMIQHSGDYREAHRRLKAGGEENYYAQDYSMEKIAELGRKTAQIGVLCLCTDEVYDEVVDNGVRAMGGGLTHQNVSLPPVLPLIENFQPTKIILGTPSIPDVIEWSFRRGVEVLPVLADSFRVSTEGLPAIKRVLRTLRRRYQWRRLASLLNSPRIRWVANHNINACNDLVRIGVSPTKVVPWDWPPIVRPEQYEPKALPPAGTVFTLALVGSLSPSKGVDDAIDAAALLRGRGRNIELRVIGHGDVQSYVRSAAGKGLEGVVHFEGRQPHKRVVDLMRSAVITLVPSHHSYPEGLPMVIYEAFATRTPIVCSDHPMFTGRVDQDAAMIVPEKRPGAIAQAALRLFDDPKLYQKMSIATLGAWNHIQCPVRWGDLLERLLEPSPEGECWLAGHALSADSGAQPRNEPMKSLFDS
jgi:glycosyltransferase involved in cell wall biosynthesis